MSARVDDATDADARNARSRLAIRLQRASAAVLALCVVVHLATMHLRGAPRPHGARRSSRACMPTPLAGVLRGLRRGGRHSCAAGPAHHCRGMARLRGAGQRRRAGRVRAGAARRRAVCGAYADRLTCRRAARSCDGASQRRRCRAGTPASGPSSCTGSPASCWRSSCRCTFSCCRRSLRHAAAVDGFLAGRAQPPVTFAEAVLVLALAAHLGGGVRLLLIEFVGWRAEWQKNAIARGCARPPSPARCCSLSPDDSRHDTTIDPAAVEDGGEGTLHPRAQDAAARHQARLRRRSRARETDATAQTRARHHGEEHRGRRGDRQPAVPGHRHPDLQRHDRARRRRRRRRS